MSITNLNIVSVDGTRNISIGNLITHGGFFHADEVVTSAMLELLSIYQRGEAKNLMEAYDKRDDIDDFRLHVGRTVVTFLEGEPPEIALEDGFILPIFRMQNFEKDYPEDERDENDFVFDVGLGEFDHHQKDARFHTETGRNYCALTLVWEQIRNSTWMEGIHESQLKEFEELFIYPIEANDVQGTKNAISMVIANFNLNEKDEAVRSCHFASAVLHMLDLIHVWFKAMAQKTQAMTHCKEIAEVCVSEATGCVYAVLPEDVQTSVAVTALPSNCIAMTYPTARGGWALRSLDDKVGEGKIFNRFLYPQEVRDNPEKIKGMKFCHPGGFYGTFETKEDAIAFCNSKHFTAHKG